MNELVTTTRHIPVPLTESQKREMHEELVVQIRDRDRIVDLLADITKRNKEVIRTRETKIKELAETLEQGHVMTSIQCRRDIDIQANTLRVIRVDNKQVIEERALTAKERAAIIDGTTERPEDKKGKR